MRTPESSRASPWSWVVSTVLIPFTQSLAQLNMLSLLGGLVTIYASPHCSSSDPGSSTMKTSSRGTPQFIGPALAGLALILISVRTLFCVETLTTILGAALLLGIPKVSRSVAPTLPDASPPRDRKRLWQRSFFRDPRVVAYLFTGIVYGVGVSALQIVLLQVVSVR